MTGGTIPPAQNDDGDLQWFVSTPWGVQDSAVRRAYKELREAVERGHHELFQWTPPAPPWSPSFEVLDEIRRQAGAPVDHRGRTLETSNAEAEVLDTAWWWEEVVRRDVRRRTERWGETWAEILAESVRLQSRRIDPPSRVVTGAEVVEWVSRFVDLDETQRVMLLSAFDPQSVDTDEVPAGFRRYHLNSPVKRKRGR